jgi:GT2 family glycosyltransferase
MSSALQSAGVVIVNYNCAPLALDGALSVLGDDPTARVVIVDNASTDNSAAYFESVFYGRRAHEAQSPDAGPATVRFANIGAIQTSIVTCYDEAPRGAGITVILARRNRGFAAGCNIGLRHLHNSAAPDWCLLLNPDALVAQGAMNAFRDRVADDRAGLCGGSVLRFESPHAAQAFGGARLDPLTLQGANFGAGRQLWDAPTQAEAEATIDYPLGAAMALRRDYLETVGCLDERYFLYFEEADWARRGGPSRPPVWAPGAVVYHRHGAAAGSRVQPGRRAPFSDYHMARSRMLYALKWRPAMAPMILIFSLAQAVRRVLRGDWRQSRAVIRGSWIFSAPPVNSSVPQ